MLGCPVLKHDLVARRGIHSSKTMPKMLFRFTNGENSSAASKNSSSEEELDMERKNKIRGHLV
jgi:hypothetical protein